jgi:hypothetical protein
MSPPGRNPLTLSVALDLGMNLAPVRVEHAPGHGARRPIYVSDKRHSAREASCIRDNRTGQRPAADPRPLAAGCLSEPRLWAPNETATESPTKRSPARGGSARPRGKIGALGLGGK